MSKPTKQSYHFFGSSAYGWACADTREEVLAKLARHAGASIIKNHKGSGGLYAWTTRVELPQESSYRIENYVPVNVPCSEARQHRIKSMNRSVEEVAKAVPLAECVLHDPYGKGTRKWSADEASAPCKE